MHSIGLVFTVSFVLTSSVNGRCPRPSELPTQYNNRKFFCARMWEHSNYHSFQSCIGARYDAYNDQNVGYIGGWWNDSVFVSCSPRVQTHTLGRHQLSRIIKNVYWSCTSSQKLWWSKESMGEENKLERWNDSLSLHMWIQQCSLNL